MKIIELIETLMRSKCPDCDGSGIIKTVTMSFSIYAYDEKENKPKLCEWCIARKKLIEELEKPDNTKNLLDDIISWEIDLSEYLSLEEILRHKYIIIQRK